jgi:hypothetical protein
VSRRETIVDTVKDSVSDLLYYDRKSDEDLPRGAIEEAITAGEITADEIVQVFQAALAKGLSWPK